MRDHRDRQPEGKAGPPADHDQAGKHEDDRRQRARRRGDGLDDIVFLDGRIANELEHRHRDDRGRDRRREGDAELEAEIDVGGGEQHGDQRAEHDSAERQFLDGPTAAVAGLPLSPSSSSPSSRCRCGRAAPGSNAGGRPASGLRRAPRRRSAARNPRSRRPRYLTRQWPATVPTITWSRTTASWMSRSIEISSRRWIASSHSSRFIMNGPV